MMIKNFKTLLRIFKNLIILFVSQYVYTGYLEKIRTLKNLKKKGFNKFK